MLRPEDRSEILRDVSAQLVEFTTLIGDLVQLARDERVAAAPEPIDFRDVVNSALDRVRLRGPGSDVRRRAEPVLRRRRVRHARAGGDQPARQRREVESARGSRPRPAGGRSAPGRRSGTGHQRGRPAVHLRPVLPGRHRAEHARHGARAVHRGQHGRAPRRLGEGEPLGTGRRRVHPAPSRLHHPGGSRATVGRASPAGIPAVSP